MASQHPQTAKMSQPGRSMSAGMADAKSCCVAIELGHDAPRERFHCPRCEYMRPLQPGEDGFQVYLRHAAYCNLATSDQLWLPTFKTGSESLPVD
jgi:hypothetical protein